jgi:phosphatidylglycerophosphate synthase
LGRLPGAPAFGKLADPIADKLLVVSTFVPFYIVSLRAPASDVPVVFGWGVLPLWVLIVVLGRELLITVFRGLAKRKGVVIAAGKEGKFKAVFQNMFMGGEILWLASFWKVFHGSYVVITLTIAVLLTAYSLVVYLWRYRALVARLTE